MFLLIQNDRLRPGVMVLLFAILLALPSAVNGKPFLFYDSAHYYDIGHLIVTKAEGIFMPSAETETPAPAAPETGNGTAGAEPANEGGLSAISGGRSPIYSLLTYILAITFSAYGIVILQSLITAWVIHRLLRVLVPSANSFSQAALVAALALLTPLGFHTGFVMPDIFAGVFVVAALILIFDKDIRLTETLVLTALLTLAATMHSTILAIGLTLAVLVFASRFIPTIAPALNQKAVLPILAALMISAAFGAVYTFTAEKITGNEIRNAPYLAARVIADGPGERYMQEHCKDHDFAICSFRGIDYVDHNDFLWGGAGAPLNWSTAPAAARTAVQTEEKDFVLAVVAAYPLAQLQATFGNAVEQALYFGIGETSAGAEVMMTYPEFSGNGLMTHVPNLDGCARGENCDGVNPFREGWAMLVYASLAIATTALVILVALNMPRLFSHAAPLDAGLHRILIAGVLVIVVLLANAAVCGGLSAPHDRYQARIAWIAALILGAGILHWKSVKQNEKSA